MAQKKKLTIQEMLAAARKTDGGGAANEAPESVKAAESEATAESPAAESPAAEVVAPEKAAAPSGIGKPAAPVKPGSLSMAEILAAARAKDSAAKGTPEKPAAPQVTAAKTTEKPTAKPAAAKAPAAAKTAAPEKAVSAKTETAAAAIKDTASILAAARTSAKPGPMSKSEAEQKGKPVDDKSKRKAEVPPMPAKPEYARPRAAAAEQPSRRGFLEAITAIVLGSPLAIGMSSLAVTHLLWGLGLARFMFPNVLTEPPTKFKVGFPSDYGPGQVENKYKAQFGVWVVRHEYEGLAQIFALQTVCTHLGCTPNWLEGEQKYKCPCHGSGFYKDGINFEGPAPRPLERFAIRISDDGQLEVDKSRKFQEEIGGWKDPASFVPV